MHAKFWSDKLYGSDHSKDIGIDWRIILDWILKKYFGRVWNGFVWIRIETNGDLL
jgi:hypothetical protein